MFFYYPRQLTRTSSCDFYLCLRANFPLVNTRYCGIVLLVAIDDVSVEQFASLRSNFEYEKYEHNLRSGLH